MTNKMMWLGMTVLMTTLGAPALCAGQSPGSQDFEEVRFEGVSSDQLAADVVVLPQMTPQRLLVRDTSLQDTLKSVHRGDRLSVAVQSENGSPVMQAASVKIVSVSAGFRVLVVAVSALAFWLVCFLITGFHPQKLIMGEDGRFSNSKFQTVLWFGVLVVAYLSTLWLRLHELGGEMLGGVNIPQNLLLLSGMSALTFTAAKGITVTKIQNARAKGQPDLKTRATTPAQFWADLTSNDSNQFDLGDFQMLIMTFLAVGTFLALIYHFLGALESRTVVYLPDVDTTILASFGLGHGAYLTKKAVGELGDT